MKFNPLLIVVIALVAYILFGNGITLEGIFTDGNSLHHLMSNLSKNISEMMEARTSVEYAKQYGYTEEKGNLTAIAFTIILVAIGLIGFKK